jgi:hypothetical protein
VFTHYATGCLAVRFLAPIKQKCGWEQTGITYKTSFFLIKVLVLLVSDSSCKQLLRHTHISIRTRSETALLGRRFKERNVPVLAPIVSLIIIIEGSSFGMGGEV